MPSYTYDVISTTTLGSAASSLSLTSIPQTYTDLHLVIYAWAESTNVVTPALQFNSDTNTNYSYLAFYGTGSTGSPNSNTGYARLCIGDYAAGVTTYAPQIFNVFINNYTDTDKYKTAISVYSQQNTGGGEVGMSGGTWRSTSAISSITITKNGGGNYAAGTRATLVGITKA